jgi:hypothetical protein
MPTWLKVLLALVVAGILGVVLLAGGAVWWARENKGKLLDDVRAAAADGDAFGRAHSQGDCIEDGLARIKSCGQAGFLCEANVKLRLTSCLSVAAPDGACERAPRGMEALKDAFAGNAECVRHGQAGSRACASLMQGLAQACAQARPSP